MKVLQHVDKNMKGLITDLQTLIRQPSVSAKNEGLEECARLVAKIMSRSGIKSAILRIGNKIPPVVYGEVKSKQNPSKTILFYNHYDVQPAEPFLKKYKNKLACDGVIWEFGYVDQKNRPIISLGMKGLLYVELSVSESIRDAHSSLAVLIKNPAWRLLEALKTLRDSDGKILIKDWYKEVDSFTKKELELIKSEPFDESSFKKEE